MKIININKLLPPPPPPPRIDISHLAPKTHFPSQYCKCFTVVEENQSIGWPIIQSKQASTHRPPPQVIIKTQIKYCSRCSSQNPSQVETLRKGESKSTKKGSKSNTNVIESSNAGALLVQPLQSIAQDMKIEIERVKSFPIKKRIAYLISKQMENRTKIEEKTNETKKNKEKVNPKRKRGNVLMDGSRCSRVNGRGWRCKQMTCFGYKLCRHHLNMGCPKRSKNIGNRNNVYIAPTTNDPIMSENIEIGSLSSTSTNFSNGGYDSNTKIVEVNQSDCKD